MKISQKGSAFIYVNFNFLFCVALEELLSSDIDTASEVNFSSGSDEEEESMTGAEEEAVGLPSNAQRAASPGEQVPDAARVASPAISDTAHAALSIASPEPMHDAPRIVSPAIPELPRDDSRAASPIDESALNSPRVASPDGRSPHMRPYFMLGNSARVLLRDYRETCMDGLEIAANQRYAGDADQEIGELLPIPTVDDLSTRERARLLLDFSRRPAGEVEQQNVYRPGGFTFNHRLEMDRRVNEGKR